MKGLEKKPIQDYNQKMKTGETCSTNRVAKWIRVFLSLGIIGAGVYYKNWIGLLGVVTLASAFLGACPLSLEFGRDIGVRLKK